MKTNKLAKAIQRRVLKQRIDENELLESIAKLAGYETAEAAADIYAAEKHAYSFDGYLHQLSKLRKVLTAGIPANVALVAVDSCLDADTIISEYNLISGGEK